MQFTSSFDIRYTENINKMKQFFGESTVVTRQQLKNYEETTGNPIPQRFWKASRVGRGMFDLEHASNVTHIEQPTKRVVHTVTETIEVSPDTRFTVEGQTPRINPNFVEWGNFKDVKALIESREFFTLYITGESGTGKNVMVDQACAQLSRPVIRVNMTSDTKEDSLLGSKTLVDGNIVWEDGPVVWAAENGAILLCDEISAMDANLSLSLQNVLEGKPFFVKGANKMVTPAEGFAIIATDNTKGRGSDSGRYIGTNILNDAFLERFEMTMIQGYPTERIERSIYQKLMENTGMDAPDFLNRLVTWVQAIRKTYNEEGIEEHITTRRACHIINVYRKLKNAEKAIELCTNRFDETTMQAMISLWDKLTVATDTTVQPTN